MKITVKFRHVQHTDEEAAKLIDYVEKRMQKLSKYSNGIMDVIIVLSTEKFRNTAEVVVVGDGIRAAAKEESTDMHTAIDLLSDKIEKQLKRFKERLQERKGGVSYEVAGPGQYRNEMEAEGIAFVTPEKLTTKPMSVEEAVDQFHILGGDFMAFHNAATGNINVLYWRKDGGLGLLQP
ncbi:MAG: ribosome-associated translation inhibitor RaiA [Dissulfuribacterales bacterium]